MPSLPLSTKCVFDPGRSRSKIDAGVSFAKDVVQEASPVRQ
jgi:hypothetical protein